MFAILQRNLDSKQQQDIAAQNFLQLLMYLRHVFLQDMALLVDLQPQVPMWKTVAIQAILTHPKWASFKEHVKITHKHTDKDDIFDFTQVRDFRLDLTLELTICADITNTEVNRW